MGTGPSHGTQRLGGLDAVRALAALAVMGFHVSVASSTALFPLDAVLADGYRGVVVFFALSGFVVARPFAAGRPRLRPYLVMRAARIVPAYLLALIGITLLTGHDQLLRHPLEYLTFTQNFDPALLAQGVLGPTWTLQLEVEFYLLLPLLMVVVSMLGARTPAVGLVVIIGLAVASLLGQLGASISPDAWVRSAGRLSLPAMLWAFLPGVALAWMLGHWPTMGERLARPAVAGLALVLVAYGWLGSSPSPLAGAMESAALVSGVVLLIPALIRPRPDLGHQAHRVAQPFTWFGRVVSYPFYLWHNAIVFVLVGAGIGGWLCAVATLVVGTLVGLASWALVESPCLRRARTIATTANERVRPGDRASTGATVQVAPRIAS